jgi:hypothetical protein
MVGGGRLSVRWSDPGNLFPWRKVFCLLKRPGVTVASLSGEMASGSCVKGAAIGAVPDPVTGTWPAEVGPYVDGTMVAEVGVGVDCGYVCDNSIPRLVSW